MRPRFQADADFNEEIVSSLLRNHPDLDFQTAEGAELRGITDPEVLARAQMTAGFSSSTIAARCLPTSPTSSSGGRSRA